MLFTEALKADWSNLRCVVRSLRDQKVPSFQKGAVIQPLKAMPLRSLKSPPRNSSSPNYLSLLTIFTPWLQEEKENFSLLWSLGLQGRKAAIHIQGEKKKAHRQKSDNFWLWFQVPSFSISCVLQGCHIFFDTSLLVFKAWSRTHLHT